jgi:hypothetical protein
MQFMLAVYWSLFALSHGWQTQSQLLALKVSLVTSEALQLAFAVAWFWLAVFHRLHWQPQAST